MIWQNAILLLDKSTLAQGEHGIFRLTVSKSCPLRINFLSTDLYGYLQAVLQGKSAGMLSDFLCEPYLKSGRLVRLFPEVEIQKWQLFLYHPYETVTPPRVL